MRVASAAARSWESSQAAFALGVERGGERGLDRAGDDHDKP
jgi:hypothetical protein